MKRKFKHTAQLLLFVIILTTAMLAWPATVSADTAVRLSGLSPGDTVQFAGYTWIVLNPSTGYLIMRDVLCNRAFDSSGRADPAFDPSRTSCLAYYLNSDSGGFYNSLLNSCPTDAALIQTHAWTIGTNSGTTNNEASSTVDAKIGLLSYSEYYTYKKISGVYSSWYWTRTWTTGDQYVWTTCEDSNSMYAVPDYYINYLVRPALYL
ncbi:MAG: cell wall-binding protein, partial [Bacillota bacterium]|nr:cell wall-binding protein [Bacillota bacterium]